MKKIDLIELMDENNTKPKDQGETWVDVLENIKRESNNFDLETMCNICIKQQYELGIKDKDGNLMTPIECTGLQTFKNKIETEHSSEVYDEIKEMLSAEELSLAEQTVNSMTWMEHTIKDEKLFSPRPYQILINSCSAKKKVLRMGRRCLEENEKVVGVKKSYRAKHLWHLFKNYKKMPEIVSYDDETGELVRTDQYLIMPNGIELVYKVTTETGHTTSATLKHPLFVFSKSGKQFEYKEIGDIDIENDQILFLDNKLHNIKSITKVGMRQTYHISVVKYETFATGAGFLHHNTGKALDVRTPIPTPNGWKTMGDLQVGDKVFDDEGNECNITFVTEYQHDRECFEITFDNGDTVVADADHQWAVSTREHRRKAIAKGLSVTDSEVVLTTKDILDFEKKHYAIRLTEPVNYNEKDLSIDPYVLGYWLGDGNTNTTILTIGDEDCSETLSRLSSKGYTVKQYKQKYAYKLENVFEVFKEEGLINNKHIPVKYLQGSVEQRLELLRGLLDSDGSYNDRDDTIEFSTSLESLSVEFKELLSSLGIKSSIKRNRSFLNGNQHKDRFRFVFKTNLKVFNLERKDKNSKTKVNSRSSYLYIKSIVPVESRPVKCISVDSQRSLYLATKNYVVTHNTFAMSVGLLHRLLVNKGYRVLMVAPMETMITEVVEQIKKFCAAMEEDPIIAATQSPIHQLTFNTGSTFKGVTAGASGAKGTRGKGADLLYVDECFPAKTKIKLHDGSVKNIEEIEVGDKVLSFDEKKGKLVSKPVVAVKCTGKKEVFSFTTVSGKKIHCTAEHPVLTRSGWMAAHEANSIATTETRSGEYFFESIIGCKLKSVEPVYNLEVKDTHTYVADGFIVHNCDFLRPKDLNSILGILLDSKNTEFWASSTPIGETNLYKLSQDPSFKEFHYPSFVIPHYSDEMDAVLRAQMDEAGYIQEVKAEFGADNDSVYPINFIEQAIVREEVIINAEYVSRNRRDFIVVMGVDWNHDKVGTRIVILAYHKLSGRYFTIVKEKVSKANWTQILAVEKIVDLNRMYEIDHIYVDEGFGITQASQLRLFSQSQYGKVPPNHPDLKLSKVVSVNFSASITLRDPISGDEYRKQTKQYMIEHSVDLLTRGLIVLQEKEDADIIAQMKNYIIKTKTVSGLKTYTYRDAQVADHDLDAFNIALHGFHTEYSEFVSTSPLVGLNTILKEGSSLPDESSIISYGSNMIINTKKSLITSKFRQDRSNREFKTRKRW